MLLGEGELSAAAIVRLFMHHIVALFWGPLNILFMIVIPCFTSALSRILFEILNSKLLCTVLLIITQMDILMEQMNKIVE